MTQRRITRHPILDVPARNKVSFFWDGHELQGFEGEMITSALTAAGVVRFGTHPKDGSAQGLFCANGQCAACLVMVDGRPVKGCMTPLRQGMVITPIDGLPVLPEDDAPPRTASPRVVHTQVLIIGGGPAGLAAAIELGSTHVPCLLVDDKQTLGGKLVLQTHKFFGSKKESYAGTRGFEIGRVLAEQVRAHSSVQIWTDSVAVAVYSDGFVGVVTNCSNAPVYTLVKPQAILVAAGARERMLAFPGNTLPGVIGAGAFQTLVNRDLVACAERILVVGAGNVGLIAAYHALQAGMEVAAVVEAMPEIGGYAVHADKLRRLGVPVLTRHTIVSATGRGRVERATIAALDEKGDPLPGSEQILEVDTVLIAVGLSKVDEFLRKGKEAGIPTYAAGDAEEIAEASAAMVNGRIAGRTIARELGYDTDEVPPQWWSDLSILRSKPGNYRPPRELPEDVGVAPVFHCLQEIPCNPCVSICPEAAIATENDSIMGVPYLARPEKCRGCLACVRICPALAITLVDKRRDPDYPTVTFPFELPHEDVKTGDPVCVVARQGEVLGRFEVVKVIKPTRSFPATTLIQVKMPKTLATKAAGIQVRAQKAAVLVETGDTPAAVGPAFVCRCERVTVDEVRAALRSGVRDLNQLKALTRLGMGSCGGKTCRPLLERILLEEGVELAQVEPLTERPLFVEVPLGILAGEGEREP